MSEALTVIDVPDTLPIGVTKRQWRLAALLPRCETAAEALRLAGYAPKTIDRMSRPTLGTLGVRRAREAQQLIRADSARGLAATARLAHKEIASDLNELEPRDRIAAGFKAYELAASLGENIEQDGSGEAWKLRLRRAIRLAYHFGRVAGSRAQHVVLSPDITPAVVAKEQNE